jgi:hypothetical protein
MDMGVSWNAREDAALQGLPLRAQIIYLRGFKPCMDEKTFISGSPRRKLSLNGLADLTQEWANKRALPRVSKDGVRASIAQLQRAGLLRRLNCRHCLKFHLPLADDS